MKSLHAYPWLFNGLSFYFSHLCLWLLKCAQGLRTCVSPEFDRFQRETQKQLILRHLGHYELDFKFQVNLAEVSLIIPWLLKCVQAPRACVSSEFNLFNAKLKNNLFCAI